MDAPATTTEICWRFIRIPPDQRMLRNWGGEWKVNRETYINGIVLTVDMDYIMGYLIEVVDRTAGVVTFMVIVLYHGPKVVDGEVVDHPHDFMTYQPDCGTFFKRTEAADPVIVGQWAVTQIYGMVESHLEAQRKG